MQPLIQPCDREIVQNFVRHHFEDCLILIVSNREPYIHTMRGDQINCEKSVGGLTVALDPVMQTVGGIWVAHGSGDADAEVTNRVGQVAVPPDDPTYTLQRIWLTKQEEEDYYLGFSNQALWPLCHNSFTRPIFREAHWEAYRRVNKKFADKIARIVGQKDAIIFTQDYHFALLPRMVRRRCPRATCVHFWHIPWPHAEVFSICPWRKEILAGLLGNQLVGFHLQNYCNNFLESVDRELEARREHERGGVVYKDDLTQVQACPISVDFESVSTFADSEACEKKVAQLRREWRLQDKAVLLGIDRLDYTKGFPDRLRAWERCLQRHPELTGKAVLVQVAAPSRQRIQAYKDLASEVQTLTDEINWRHATNGWKPVLNVAENLPRDEVLALFKMADVCIVSSLQDGMNLVAKEFISARPDEQGVLLLSRFAGAASELTESVLINPYAEDEFADTINKAIHMSSHEQRRRMRRLRWIVRHNNIYTWTMSILEPLRHVRALGQAMG